MMNSGEPITGKGKAFKGAGRFDILRSRFFEENSLQPLPSLRYKLLKMKQTTGI